MLVTSDEGKVPGFSRPIGEAAGSEWEVHIRFVTGCRCWGGPLMGTLLWVSLLPLYNFFQ